MEGWFYEDNGNARGPVPKADLAAMLRNGSLPPSTQVWTEAFGETWRPADQTDLMPKRVRPPPLRAAQLSPPVAPAMGPALDAVSAHKPMMPGGMGIDDDAPDTAWVWLIALSPLALVAISAAITVTSGYPDPRTDRIVNICAGVALFICAALDSSAITEVGRNPKGRYLVPFMLLTPLGYLWRRASVIGATYRHVWIWLACAAALVVGEFVLLGAGG